MVFSICCKATSSQENPFSGAHAHILHKLVLCCIRDTVTWLHSNSGVSSFFLFPLVMMCLAYCSLQNRTKKVRNVGCVVQCYHDVSAVTDELVEKILQPGLQPGAADVFLDFICYSGGPLPEEMLPNVKVPSRKNQIFTFRNWANQKKQLINKLGVSTLSHSDLGACSC